MLDNFSDVGGAQELAAIAREQQVRKETMQRVIKFLENEQAAGNGLYDAIESLKAEFGLE